mmetsp:Transcript_11609/g.36844  ORF Transcript_11609/g.36844 Transcript_11609/m.36844 type:complete len:353 (+) Transcript_11609:107-1165(+)
MPPVPTPRRVSPFLTHSLPRTPPVLSARPTPPVSNIFFPHSVTHLHLFVASRRCPLPLVHNKADDAHRSHNSERHRDIRTNVRSTITPRWRWRWLAWSRRCWLAWSRRRWLARRWCWRRLNPLELHLHAVRRHPVRRSIRLHAHKLVNIRKDVSTPIVHHRRHSHAHRHLHRVRLRPATPHLPLEHSSPHLSLLQRCPVRLVLRSIKRPRLHLSCATRHVRRHIVLKYAARQRRRDNARLLRHRILLCLTVALLTHLTLHALLKLAKRRPINQLRLCNCKINRDLDCHARLHAEHGLSHIRVAILNEHVILASRHKETNTSNGNRSKQHPTVDQTVSFCVFVYGQVRKRGRE